MEEFLWSEKYRPHKVSDIILPERYKKALQTIVDKKKVPNLLLSGPPGVGKTSAARAVLDEIGADYMIINASLDGSKDTLRNEIKDFATTMSMEGGRKYVILDEADHLSHHMQPALRSFMEEYSSNCGFILTCNFPHKIIEPLKSRCASMEFNFSKKEKVSIAKEMLNRLVDVLNAENVEHDKKVVAAVLAKHFPDMRRLLNELQSYSNNGKIDSGILVDFDEQSIQSLMQAIKEKKFDAMRAWVTENEFDDSDVYTKLYEVGGSYLKKDSIPQMIMILAEYQYKSAFAVNKDINLMACFTEIAATCDFE